MEMAPYTSPLSLGCTRKTKDFLNISFWQDISHMVSHWFHTLRVILWLACVLTSAVQIVWWVWTGGPMGLHTCVKSEHVAVPPLCADTCSKHNSHQPPLRWCRCESLSLSSSPSLSPLLYDPHPSRNSLHAWVRIPAQLKHIWNLWTGGESMSKV